MSKSTMNLLTPVTVCVLLAFSGTLFSASAQETAPAKQAQKPAAAPLPPDPLRGPKVEDAGIPGETRRFGGPSKDRKDRTEPAIPHRAFVRALENMQNSNPDGSLKLNAEQLTAPVALTENTLAAALVKHSKKLPGVVADCFNRIVTVEAATVPTVQDTPEVEGETNPTRTSVPLLYPLKM